MSYYEWENNYMNYYPSEEELQRQYDKYLLESQYHRYLSEMKDQENERYQTELKEQQQEQYQQMLEEQQKDQQALEPLSLNDPLHEILHLPLGPNDINAKTVGEYLSQLLVALWKEADGFDSKRPFGNSDWQYPVYTAMIKAGMMEGNVFIDDFGEDVESTYEDEVKADELISQAIIKYFIHE